MKSQEVDVVRAETQVELDRKAEALADLEARLSNAESLRENAVTAAHVARSSADSAVAEVRESSALWLFWTQNKGFPFSTRTGILSRGERIAPC